MRAADIAMYQAKAKGRNQFMFYEPHMNTRAMELLVLENELRKALDEQHLELFYQPLVDLRDGRMVGAEALVRWRHPLRGIVPPGDFIALAEDTGLIIPIGKWIFGEACRQARCWQDKGYEEIKLSVNLSAKQFQHQALLSDIEEQLQLHTVDGRLISVELTESALMNNAEKAIETMEALNKLGLEIAIDDFGTGYSSLAYLKRFPIQKLKIDKTFVCDLANNHSDAAIIQATLALAKSLSLDVVAEGVETQDQLRLLREFGCGIGQGFLFGRPVPADEFERSHLVNQTRFAVGRCT